MTRTDHPGDVGAPLEVARRSEKEQALLYRSLAARAEAAGEVDLAQRFHDLHADEQHHLSRLTARLLELGLQPQELAKIDIPDVGLDRWEDRVRTGEEAEVRLYQGLLETAVDPPSRALFDSILEVERKHLAELGGKWTMA